MWNTLINYFEIFTLVTGVMYLVFEILQKNAMWIVGILSAATATIVFFHSRLFASMGLNIYYLGVSVWGLYVWARDSKIVRETTEESSIHLRKPSATALIISAVVLVVGTLLLVRLLDLLGDPMSYLDAGVTVLSAIATIWLARSYLQQWLLWIVADLFTAIMCIKGGMYWMTALYAIYSASALYGYIHWRRRGIFIS